MLLKDFLIEETEHSTYVEFPVYIATKAYMFLSHTPKDRAMEDARNYEQDLRLLRGKLNSLAKTDEQKEEVENMEHVFALEYVKRIKVYYEALSKTSSPVIVGPAKFAEKRNAKLSLAAKKIADKFNEWKIKTEAELISKLKGEESQWDKVKHQIDSEISKVIEAKKQNYKHPLSSFETVATKTLVQIVKFWEKKDATIADEAKKYIVLHAKVLDVSSFPKSWKVNVSPVAKDVFNIYDFSPVLVKNYSGKIDIVRSHWLDEQVSKGITTIGLGETVEAGLAFAAIRMIELNHRSGPFQFLTLYVSIDSIRFPERSLQEVTKRNPEKFWSVGFSPKSMKFVVTEYDMIDKGESVAAILAKKGLGYKLDKSGYGKEPMVYDLETNEEFGRMNANEAATFASTYVRKVKEIGEDKKSFSLTPLQFKEMMNAVKDSILKDKIRSYLHGVFLEAYNGYFLAVASNGKILTTKKVSGTIPHNIFLPVPALKAMAAFYKDKRVPVIHYSHEEQKAFKKESYMFYGYLEISADGKVEKFPLNDVFVDYKQVLLPDNHQIAVVLNAKKVLKDVQAIGGKVKGRINIIFSEHSTVANFGIRKSIDRKGNVDNISQNGHFNYEIEYWENTEQSVNVETSYEDFVNALKSMKTIVTMYASSSRETAKISDGKGHEHTLSTVKI